MSKYLHYHHHVVLLSATLPDIYKGTSFLRERVYRTSLVKKQFPRPFAEDYLLFMLKIFKNCSFLKWEWIQLYLGTRYDGNQLYLPFNCVTMTFQFCQKHTCIPGAAKSFQFWLWSNHQGTNLIFSGRGKRTDLRYEGKVWGHVNNHWPLKWGNRNV